MYKKCYLYYPHFLKTNHSLPTGFINVLDKSYFELSVPRVLSFVLNFLTFHRQVITAYRPIKGCFCAISKERVLFMTHTYVHYFHFQTNFALHIRFRDFGIETNYQNILPSKISKHLISSLFRHKN